MSNYSINILSVGQATEGKRDSLLIDVVILVYYLTGNILSLNIVKNVILYLVVLGLGSALYWTAQGNFCSDFQ